MSWYLDKMEQLLSDDDREMLRHIYEPRVVVVPPRDTYIFSTVAPDGELRLYGGMGRGKHQQHNAGGGYLYSRDCGLSWHQHLGSYCGEVGPGQRSPTGRYLLADGNDVRIFEKGPDFPDNHEVRLRPGMPDEYGCSKHPVFLTKKEGRCIVTIHKDLPDDNFQPVVCISDDDGETWRCIELPTSENSEIFYPDKGYRWRNRGSEPAVCELADGTLYLISRTSTDHFNEYYSYDHGDTWIGSGQESKIHATLCTPVFLRLHDGRVILFWNNNHIMPKYNHHHLWPNCHYAHFIGSQEDMFTNRDCAHAAVSVDGKNWIGQREIQLSCIRNDADYRRAGGRYNMGDKSLQQFEAYELPMNKVFVIMGQSIASRRGVIFDVDWLLEQEREEDFSHGLDQLSTHQFVKSIRGSWFGHSSANRVPGAVMATDPEDQNREVAQIARYHDENLVDELCGMVWNYPMSPKGEVTVEINILQSGVRVSLSDHWQNPSDPFVEQIAAASFTLEQTDLLHEGWNTVKLRFDTAAGDVAVLDELGDVMFHVPYHQEVLGGLSYIHFQTLAEEQDTKGTLIRYLKKEAR